MRSSSLRSSFCPTGACLPCMPDFCRCPTTPLRSGMACCCTPHSFLAWLPFRLFQLPFPAPPRPHLFARPSHTGLRRNLGNVLALLSLTLSLSLSVCLSVPPACRLPFLYHLAFPTIRSQTAGPAALFMATMARASADSSTACTPWNSFLRWAWMTAGFWACPRISRRSSSPTK